MPTRIIVNAVSGSLAACSLLVATAAAQLTNPNIVPNPYTTVDGDWVPLPDGREWGATSTVYNAGNGLIWAAERCGGNTNCLDTPEIDPVMLIDPADGTIVRSFGRGLIVWPHGIHVDRDGNVWIADARGDEERMKGHQVLKFSPEGELLMSLGQAGVAGNDENTFDQPCDVFVAPNGDIFVADGHGQEGNNRIVKYDRDGNFLLQFGATGTGRGELREPHALAMDSQGRLFVADRANNRVQIFDQDGNFIDAWSQFGRPSGVYIDADDMLYVADSESNSGRWRNPGWYRGIRIGSATDGFVTAFIPDPNTGAARFTGAAEGVTTDNYGNVYGAEVADRRLRKYVLNPLGAPLD